MGGLPPERSPAVPTKQSAGALASLRPRLSGWRPEYPAPANPESLEAALVEADACLAPIDSNALAVLIDRTLSLWTVPDNWRDIAGFYLEALEDVPHDLVELALKGLRLRRRWINFPKPADLRAPIQDELDQCRAH